MVSINVHNLTRGFYAWILIRTNLMIEQITDINNSSGHSIWYLYLRNGMRTTYPIRTMVLHTFIIIWCNFGQFLQVISFKPTAAILFQTQCLAAIIKKKIGQSICTFFILERTEIKHSIISHFSNLVFIFKTKCFFFH